MYDEAESPVRLLFLAFDNSTRVRSPSTSPGKWENDSDSDEESLDPDEVPHVIQFTVS